MSYGMRVVEDKAENRRLVEDPGMRGALVDLYEFTVLLENCILDKNYRLSDDWTRPIRLSQLGEEIISEVRQKHSRFKPNDLTMAVFLSFDCTEGLLVDLSTDIEALRLQLSREILASRIRFPYIFGRELHDIAAELYPSRRSLDNSQTLEVLKRLPVGVFQAGRTVVGPFGCTYSDISRSALPTVRVPGYLCSDMSCTTIHTLQLNTASTAITKTREIVSAQIAKHSESSSAGERLMRDAILLEVATKDKIYITTNLFDVLSDGLSQDEQRIVVDRVLRKTFKTDGRRLDLSRRIGAVITNPTNFVAELDTPQLMQIAMIHSDEAIIYAIDEAVKQEDIKIEDFEVRVSKLQRWDTRGKLPRAEIGKLGVRFAAPQRSVLVAQRMLDLLHTIYYESSIWDAADLAYALDAPSTLSEGELLDRALRDRSPSDLLTSLVLPNRRTLGLAAEKLGVVDFEEMSREEVLPHLRWKIGEPSEVAFTDLRRVKQFLDVLTRANEDLSDSSILRGHAMNAFTALEDTLNRALVFCVWSLTTDHYLSKDPFVYDALSSASLLEFIEQHAPTDDHDLKLNADGINTLGPLSSGFARLAKGLRSLIGVEQPRPSEDVPVECVALGKPFEFMYRSAFLNLSGKAQSDVLGSLQSISKIMQSESVLDVRNAMSHGNRDFPPGDRISKAIEQLNALTEILHRGGYYPRIYELVKITEDGIGRVELMYLGDGEEIAIRHPGWAHAPRLPWGDSRLTIFAAAQTVSSGPLRFKLKPRPGPDPYWDDWPRRLTAKGDFRPKHVYDDSSDFAESA
jgi:hypothetical protein